VVLKRFKEDLQILGEVLGISFITRFLALCLLLSGCATKTLINDNYFRTRLKNTQKLISVRYDNTNIFFQIRDYDKHHDLLKTCPYQSYLAASSRERVEINRHQTWLINCSTSLFQDTEISKAVPPLNTAAPLQLASQVDSNGFRSYDNSLVNCNESQKNWPGGDAVIVYSVSAEPGLLCIKTNLANSGLAKKEYVRLPLYNLFPPKYDRHVKPRIVLIPFTAAYDLISTPFIVLWFVSNAVLGGTV
jgi:hypothetical protein